MPGRAFGSAFGTMAMVIAMLAATPAADYAAGALPRRLPGMMQSAVQTRMTFRCCDLSTEKTQMVLAAVLGNEPWQHRSVAIAVISDSRAGCCCTEPNLGTEVLNAVSRVR